MKKIISLVCTLSFLLMFVSAGTALSASKTAPASDDKSAVTESAVIDKIDINSADGKKLETLPGIGPKMAARITNYRNVNGGFKTVDELQKVKGIGPKLLQKIKHLVKVS